MKGTKLDSLYRIHIPNKIVKEIGWKENDIIYTVIEGEKLSLFKGIPDQECPVCKQKFTSTYKFCPHCGQYLVKKEDEDNATNK